MLWGHPVKSIPDGLLAGDDLSLPALTARNIEPGLSGAEERGVNLFFPILPLAHALDRWFG